MNTKTTVGRPLPKIWRNDHRHEESTEIGGQKARNTAIAKGGVARNPNFIQPNTSKPPLGKAKRR